VPGYRGRLPAAPGEAAHGRLCLDHSVPEHMSYDQNHTAPTQTNPRRSHPAELGYINSRTSFKSICRVLIHKLLSAAFCELWSPSPKNPFVMPSVYLSSQKQLRDDGRHLFSYPCSAMRCKCSRSTALSHRSSPSLRSEPGSPCRSASFLIFPQARAAEPAVFHGRLRNS